MAMMIYSNVRSDRSGGWQGLCYQRGWHPSRPVPEHLAIFWTILLAQYWLNIFNMSSLTYFGHCNTSLKLIQYKKFVAGIWLQSNVWIRGREKGLVGSCQVTAVTTHPGDKRGVIGSKLRPTYLKHAAKSFQPANPTSRLVTYTLSLVVTEFCPPCTKWP